MDEYTYIRTVGEGAYGDVWLTQQRGGAYCAVKVFKQAHEDPEIKALAKREARTLQAISHVNCVKLLDAFKSKSGRVYLVFEYVEKSVFGELDRNPHGLPSRTTKMLTWQLLHAVAYLHERKIVHRDIKPANILVTSGGVVKLCDFGFARTTRCGPREQQPMSTYCVTRWYRPPEVLVSDSYGPSADIWSVGCTIAEVATGRPLFPGKSSADQLWRIMRCLGPLAPQHLVRLAADERLHGVPVPQLHRSLRQRLPELEPRLLQLVEACLQPNPLLRPTASELLQMPYFWDVPQLVAGTPLAGLYPPAEKRRLVAPARPLQPQMPQQPAWQRGWNDGDGGAVPVAVTVLIAATATATGQAPLPSCSPPQKQKQQPALTEGGTAESNAAAAPEAAPAGASSTPSPPALSLGLTAEGSKPVAGRLRGAGEPQQAATAELASKVEAAAESARSHTREVAGRAASSSGGGGHAAVPQRLEVQQPVGKPRGSEDEAAGCAGGSTDFGTSQQQTSRSSGGKRPSQPQPLPAVSAPGGQANLEDRGRRDAGAGCVRPMVCEAAGARPIETEEQVGNTSSGSGGGATNDPALMGSQTQVAEAAEVAEGQLEPAVEVGAKGIVEPSIVAELPALAASGTLGAAGELAEASLALDEECDGVSELPSAILHANHKSALPAVRVSACGSGIAPSGEGQNPLFTDNVSISPQRLARAKSSWTPTSQEDGRPGAGSMAKSASLPAMAAAEMEAVSGREPWRSQLLPVQDSAGASKGSGGSGSSDFGYTCNSDTRLLRMQVDKVQVGCRGALRQQRAGNLRGARAAVAAATAAAAAANGPSGRRVTSTGQGLAPTTESAAAWGMRATAHAREAAAGAAGPENDGGGQTGTRVVLTGSRDSSCRLSPLHDSMPLCQLQTPIAAGGESKHAGLPLPHRRPPPSSTTVLGAPAGDSDSLFLLTGVPHIPAASLARSSAGFPSGPTMNLHHSRTHPNPTDTEANGPGAPVSRTPSSGTTWGSGFMAGRLGRGQSDTLHGSPSCGIVIGGGSGSVVDSSGGSMSQPGFGARMYLARGQQTGRSRLGSGMCDTALCSGPLPGPAAGSRGTTAPGVVPSPRLQSVVGSGAGPRCCDPLSVMLAAGVQLSPVEGVSVGMVRQLTPTKELESPVGVERAAKQHADEEVGGAGNHGSSGGFQIAADSVNVGRTCTDAVGAQGSNGGGRCGFEKAATMPPLQSPDATHGDVKAKKKGRSMKGMWKAVAKAFGLRPTAQTAMA